MAAAFTLGEITVNDPQLATVSQSKGGRQQATLVVFMVVGKPLLHLQGLAERHQSHTVVTLLTMILDLVAELPYGSQRKIGILRFGFLQADNIGPMPFDQLLQLVQAGANTVNIEGHDFH